MEWIILFIVSWVLLIVFGDWKRFKINCFSGIAAMALQLAVDTNAISNDFYNIHRPVITVWGSSLFFAAGPVFVIGTLIAQFHPCKRWMKILNVFVFAFLYSLQELLLFKAKALEYVRWGYSDSIVVNICSMIIISWFSIVVLNEKGTVWR